MPATYERIATSTLGAAANNIVFSSIPATYTDLRLVVNAAGTSGTIGLWLRFNSDTAANYSYTSIYGDGTSAVSAYNTSTAYLLLSSGLSTTKQLCTADVILYAGSTNKSALINMNGDSNGSGRVTNYVGMWRSTAAINSVTVLSDTAGNRLAAGTVATLYGILKA